MHELKKTRTLPAEELRCLILAALFVAVDIALTRVLGLAFAPVPLVRYSIQFLCLAMMGWMTGPGWALAGAVVADLIGVVMNPLGGNTILPWVTFCAAAAGLLYGFFLYGKRPAIWRAAVPVFIHQVVICLPLYAYFGQYMNGTENIRVNFLLALPWRLACVIPYTLVIYGTQKALERPLRIKPRDKTANR